MQACHRLKKHDELLLMLKRADLYNRNGPGASRQMMLHLTGHRTSVTTYAAGCVNPK